MKINLFFLLFLALAITSNAQKKDGMKWGKVTYEDLTMTEYEADPEATALVLGDVGTAVFETSTGELVLTYSKHKRIKILKRAGFEYGNVSFNYFSGNNLERLIGLRAQILEKGGKITKLSKKDFFETDLDEHRTKVSFTFPNLTEGAIVEYSYQVTSKIQSIIVPWYFADEIPVRFSEFTFAHPRGFDYIEDIRQGDKIKLVKENNYKTTIVYSYRNLGSRIVETKTEQFDIDMVKKTYRSVDVPAVRNVDHLPTMRDYYPRMSMQLAYVNLRGSRAVLPSWDKLTEWFMESSNLGARLISNFHKPLKQEVTALCANLKSPTEKIAAIHNYVVQNYQWVGGYTKYSPQDLELTYVKKSGNSSDLSMLLIALLRSQGIDAYPALVSTREHGKVNTTQPFVNQFNHVMAYVNLDGKNLLMDAVEKRPFSLPSKASQNYTALVIFGAQKFDFINIKPLKSFTTISLTAKMEEGIAKGQIDFDFKNNEACFVRDKLLNEDEKGEEQFVQGLFLDEAKSVTISDLELQDLNLISDQVKGKAQFELPLEGDDMIYLTPFLGAGNNENPFVQATRDLPVDFANTLGQTLVFNFEIPAGYEVETMPQVSKVTLSDKGGQFQYIPSLNGNTLQIMSRINLNRTYFEQAEYEYLKAFFDKIVEIHAEPIVLKKL